MTTNEYQEISQCNGTLATILSDSFCEVEMSVFTSSLGYLAGEPILTKSQAFNSKGGSNISPQNLISVKAQTKPASFPQNIIITSTSSTSFSISWNEMSSDSENGNSPITRYNIYHNGGSGTTYSNNISSVTYLGTPVGPLSQGSSYLIRVSASNIHGEGVASIPVSVIAAFTPGIMNAPIFSQSA